jgi:folate-binding protein YgfZ
MMTFSTSMTSSMKTAGVELELKAWLEGAGVARLDGAGWIRVTGEDRVRWLNGMVTNSVQEMTGGDGAYSFLLNVQGRIQGDAVIFAGVADDDDALLMETSKAQVEGMMALLDRYIIMDDVELEDVSARRVGLLVAGPHAEALLERVGIAVAGLDAMAMRSVHVGDAEVRVVRGHGVLVARYEIWGAEDVITRVERELTAAGAVVCGAESLEWLRMLEGTPVYGVDIREKELPQETGETRALHFNKGCYLGQEIVERIRSRGNVHRGFSGFLLEGELPAAGAMLEADGKQVGELTSVAAIPLGGGMVQLGLGYVRREAVERGSVIGYAGGTARPVALPFPVAAVGSAKASE